MGESTTVLQKSRFTWSLSMASSFSFSSSPTSVFLLCRLWISWKHNHFKLLQHCLPNFSIPVRMWTIHLSTAPKCFNQCQDLVSKRRREIYHQGWVMDTLMFQGRREFHLHGKVPPSPCMTHVSLNYRTDVIKAGQQQSAFKEHFTLNKIQFCWVLSIEMEAQNTWQSYWNIKPIIGLSILRHFLKLFSAWLKH